MVGWEVWTRSFVVFTRNFLLKKINSSIYTSWTFSRRGQLSPRFIISNNNLLFNILSTFRCNVNLTLLRNTPKCLNKNHSWNHSRTCRWIVKNCFYLKRKRILQKEEDEEESLASDPHPDLRVVAALRNKRRRNPLLKMERELCVTGRRDRDRPWKLGPRRRCTHPTTRNLGKSLSRIWFLARSTSHRSSRSPACIYVPTYLVRPASPPPPTPPAILVIRPGIRRRKKSAGTPSRREEFPTSSSSKFRPMFLSKFHRKDWISREQATFWVEVYDKGFMIGGWVAWTCRYQGTGFAIWVGKLIRFVNGG